MVSHVVALSRCGSKQPKLEEKVRRLGGKVLQRGRKVREGEHELRKQWRSVTHCVQWVYDEYTVQDLACAVMGKWVVSRKWLEDSIRQSRFATEGGYGTRSRPAHVRRTDTLFVSKRFLAREKRGEQWAATLRGLLALAGGCEAAGDAAASRFLLLAGKENPAAYSESPNVRTDAVFFTFDQITKWFRYGGDPSGYGTGANSSTTVQGYDTTTPVRYDPPSSIDFVRPTKQRGVEKKQQPATVPLPPVKELLTCLAPQAGDGRGSQRVIQDWRRRVGAEIDTNLRPVLPSRDRTAAEPPGKKRKAAPESLQPAGKRMREAGGGTRRSAEKQPAAREAAGRQPPADDRRRTAAGKVHDDVPTANGRRVRPPGGGGRERHRDAHDLPAGNGRRLDDKRGAADRERHHRDAPAGCDDFPTRNGRHFDAPATKARGHERHRDASAGEACKARAGDMQTGNGRCLDKRGAADRERHHRDALAGCDDSPTGNGRRFDASAIGTGKRGAAHRERQYRDASAGDHDHDDSPTRNGRPFDTPATGTGKRGAAHRERRRRDADGPGGSPTRNGRHFDAAATGAGKRDSAGRERRRASPARKAPDDPATGASRRRVTPRGGGGPAAAEERADGTVAAHRRASSTGTAADPRVKRVDGPPEEPPGGRQRFFVRRNPAARARRLADIDAVLCTTASEGASGPHLPGGPVRSGSRGSARFRGRSFEEIDADFGTREGKEIRSLRKVGVAYDDRPRAVACAAVPEGDV
ncbi:hypothetical protein DIPPA_21723 [Diplonema papillatum]|nr:hypothetical protein DIPPA_21723 [Diplonema papillatum]